MSEKITYRVAIKQDYPAVLKLYNEMYGSQRSVSDIDWMVNKNPAGKAVHFIALAGNEVVGMQSLIPYDFIKQGTLITTYKSEDSLIKRELRGKGIFSKLYEMVHGYADGKLIWGLTDKKEILERLQMPSSERLTIAVSVKRPGIVVDKKGIQRSVAKTLYYSFLYLKSSFRSKQFVARLELSELNSDECGSDRLSDFFYELSTSNPEIYFPKMDKDYFDWRMKDNPNLERYKLIVSSTPDGTVQMCSLIGLEKKSAHWLSFYSLNQVDHAEKLAHISALRKRLFDSGVNIIHAWLFRCNTRVKEVKDIFLEAGFYAVRDGLWIVHNSETSGVNVHDLYFSGQLGIR